MNRYSMINGLFLVTVPEFAELVVMPCTHGKIREEVSMDLPVDSW
jgi:hypothetical protein